MMTPRGAAPTIPQRIPIYNERDPRDPRGGVSGSSSGGGGGNSDHRDNRPVMGPYNDTDQWNQRDRFVFIYLYIY